MTRNRLIATLLTLALLLGLMPSGAAWAADDTVTFYLKDGNSEPGGPYMTLDTTSAAGAEAQRPGYTFEGWSRTEDGGVPQKPPAFTPAAGTYYAQWETGYEITFKNDFTESHVAVPDNDKTKRTNVEGKLASLPRLEDNSTSGYYFVGWCLKRDESTKNGVGDTVTTETLFTKSTEVYAKWTRYITVHIDVRGEKDASGGYTGEYSLADEYSTFVSPIQSLTKHAEGEPLPNTLPVLTVQNHVFLGWHIRVPDANGQIVETEVKPDTAILAQGSTETEATVYAKWEKHTSDLKVTGTYGVDYVIEPSGTATPKRITILSDNAISITGSGDDTIVVASGKHPTITLVGVTISSSTASPILLQSGASPTIVLNGENKLTGGGGYAGLQCTNTDPNAPTSVTIKGPGSLTVSGGSSSSGGNAAGIGNSSAGAAAGEVGKITISDNAWVVASGYGTGAAIGDAVGTEYTADSANTAGWKGVVFGKNNKGIVYGNDVAITLAKTLSSGQTLTVGNGRTITFDEGLTVSSGATLTVEQGGKVKFLPGSNFTHTGGTVNLYSIACLEGATLTATEATYTVFTVTFDANGGTLAGGKKTIEVQTGEDKYIAEDKIPAKPTRTGKIFTGWTEKNATNEYDLTAEVTENITLIANWKDEYTITFNANGGTLAVTSAKTDKEGKITQPANPTRTGYTFDGWYTALEGGTQINFSDAFTGNTTIYAHWTEDTTTTPPTGGGGGGSPTNSAQPGLMSLPVAALPDAGIMTADDSTGSSTGSATADPVVVQFYINNTDDPKTKEACLTLPKATSGTQVEPTPYRKDGYVWAGDAAAGTKGWTIDAKGTADAAPGNDLTCYAKWKKIITITLDYGDFTIKNDFPKGVEAVSGDKLGDAKLAELKTYLEKTDLPYKDGPQTSNDTHSYKFEHWYLDDPEVKVSENTVFTEENCTLHIKWKKCPPFTVYFVLDEEDAKSTYSVKKTDGVEKEVVDDKIVDKKEPLIAYLSRNSWPADFSTTEDLNTRNGFTFKGWRTKNNAVMPDGEAKSEHTQVDGTAVTDYDRSWIEFTEDTYLYAIWGAPYLIKYNANGGRFGSSEQYMDKTDGNNCFVDPRDKMVSVAGQSLKEWNTKPDGTGKTFAAGTPVNAAEDEIPLEVYAIWAAPFAITLDAGDGAEIKDDNVKNDNGKYYIMTDETGKLLVLPDPKRGDDLFDGWYIKTESGEERVELNRVFEAPATIYAKWAVPHTITFNVNSRDGYFLSDTSKTQKELTQKTELDGKLAVFPEVRRDRSKFLGWYTAKAGGDEKTVADVFTEDTTLYAQWKKDPPYDIVFHANGGTFMTGTAGDVTETTAMDGKLGLKAPADPGNRGYTFTGWYDAAKDGELIAKDQSELKDYAFADDADLYAQWSNLEYTITFDFNLASIDKNAPVLKRRGLDTTGQVLQITRLPYGFYKEYELKGWYTTSDKDPKPEDEIKPNGTKFTKGVTVYAHWEKSETYTSKWPTVYFHEEEGKDPSMGLEVWENSKLFVVPDLPAKTGYDFGGWYDGSKFIDEETVFTEDAHVWAKWYKICTVTFNANGGEVDPESATTSMGKLTALPTPVREGWTFDGWYTAAEKGKKIDLTTEYETDTTIYAHWSGGGGEEPTPPDDPNKPDDPGTVTPQPPASGPFTITFEANGGNVSPTTTTTSSDGKLSSYPTPRRLGCVFEGWYNGNTLVNTSTVFTSDTTLTARWSGAGVSSGGSNWNPGSSSPSNEAYRVTISSGSGGVIIPLNWTTSSNTYANEGQQVAFIAHANSGYRLKNYVVTDSRDREIRVTERQGSYTYSYRDSSSVYTGAGVGPYYTFTMPASRVEIYATFEQTGSGTTSTTTPTTPGTTPTTPTPPTTPTTPSVGATSGDGVFSAPVMTTLPMPYTDVPQSAWYYTSVDYMWKRSLMGGVSATKFGPAATTSRAMIWTILARLGGVDVTTGGVWYETARSWAMSYGVSDGVDPNSPVTREDLVAMIWRFSGSPAASYDLGRFGDRGQIETYQGECAFRWAAAQGLVNGDSSRLNPQGTATRAEVAAIMTRFCQSR